MNGFSILMFIFGTCVLLAGLFMYKGHKIGLLEGRPAFQNLKKEEWTSIGKWTMITSIFIFLLAILGIIFKF